MIINSRLGDSTANSAGGDIITSRETLYTVNCGFKPSAVNLIYKPDGEIRVCTYNSEQSTTKPELFTDPYLNQ